MKRQFRPHGHCDFNVENNIILILAYGPWNDEYFEELHQKLSESVGLVDYNNFAVYIEAHGEAIAMQGGIEKHRQFISGSPVKAVAVNLGNCTTKSITEALSRKIYQSCNITHDFFTDKDNALAWLDEKLTE